jgi:hypothetical protein
VWKGQEAYVEWSPTESGLGSKVLFSQYEVSMNRIVVVSMVVFGLPLTLFSATAKPGDEPVAWYTGDATTNSLTMGPPGTLQNGAGYDHGVVGQAFSFNGSSQQVSMPNNPLWNFGTSDFSISAWVNVSVSTPPQGLPIVAHDEGPGHVNKWVFILGGTGLSSIMWKRTFWIPAG